MVYLGLVILLIFLASVLFPALDATLRVIAAARERHRTPPPPPPRGFRLVVIQGGKQDSQKAS